VAAAGSDDASAARTALAALCQAYWYPLYAYVRRRGADADQALDLTQGFLTSLIERRDFQRLHPARGRFRAFLLGSFKHFLANEFARQRTQKRGGGAHNVPLTMMDEAEERYQIEPADVVTPETLYERRWALLVLERVLATLRTDWEAAGKTAEFDGLKDSLLGQTTEGGYAALAERLGTTPGAIKVAVHRLRRKFRAALRTRIAETVDDPADVEEELRYLIRVLTM
jgi:RNA polymerase sigma-70 factor (ECF subfamily)